MKEKTCSATLADRGVPEDALRTLPPGLGLSGVYEGFFLRLFGHMEGIFFWMLFEIDFGSILVRFSCPTCLPKAIKTNEISMPRGMLSWTSIFNQFLIDFASRLEPSEPNLALAR